MKKIVLIPISTVALCVSACGPDGVTSIPAPPPQPFETVINHVKYEISQFRARSGKELSGLNATNVCGEPIELKIVGAKLTLTGTANKSGEFSGGLSVPVGPITIGANGEKGRTYSNAITTTLTIDLAKDKSTTYPQSSDYKGTPIADSLIALEQVMARTGQFSPCLELGSKEAGNSVRFAFGIADRTEVGRGLEFLVFSFGAEESQTISAANTIEFYVEGDGQFLTRNATNP